MITTNDYTMLFFSLIYGIRFESLEMCNGNLFDGFEHTIHNQIFAGEKRTEFEIEVNGTGRKSS